MSERETLEVLKAARELISDEERWTQGGPAKNDAGALVLATSFAATKWCAVGACARVAPGRHMAAVTTLGEAVGRNVGYFNDTHSHAEVLARFDSAIAKLEGER